MLYRDPSAESIHCCHSRICWRGYWNQRCERGWHGGNLEQAIDSLSAELDPFQRSSPDGASEDLTTILTGALVSGLR